MKGKERSFKITFESFNQRKPFFFSLQIKVNLIQHYSSLLSAFIELSVAFSI